MFALETDRDHSVIFEIAPKYCISDSSVDYESYSISSKGYIPWDIVKIQCSKYNHGVTQNEISASSGLN